MTILVIEDEVAVRQTLVDLLELNGHSVLAAADGVGAKLWPASAFVSPN